MGRVEGYVSMSMKILSQRQKHGVCMSEREGERHVCEDTLLVHRRAQQVNSSSSVAAVARHPHTPMKQMKARLFSSKCFIYDKNSSKILPNTL